MVKYEIPPPIQPQPEFPELDLTEQNARHLSLMLANKQTVHDYHGYSETAIPVFRRLHPALAGGVARTREGVRVDAMSHGMMVFEAITSAVTSVNPERVSLTALQVVVGSEKTVRRIIEPAATKDVRELFEQCLPRTADVVAEASERFYPAHVEYAKAGAALECLIVSQALRIDHGS